VSSRFDSKWGSCPQFWEMAACSQLTTKLFNQSTKLLFHRKG
jgi:hypothetical protein